MSNSGSAFSWIHRCVESARGRHLPPSLLEPYQDFRGHKVKDSKGPGKNRILMLLENLPFPQDLRVRREAYALTSAGYPVTVICPSAKGQPSREIVNGVTVYRYPAPPL